MCNNKGTKPCKYCGVGLYWYTDRNGKRRSYETFGQPNTWHYCVNSWMYTSHNARLSNKRSGW